MVDFASAASMLMGSDFFDIGASDLLSGFGSLMGGKSANRDSRRAAREQMAFQKSVLQNRYQWQVNDLENAGLNPMLAYGQTPGMAQGAMPNVVDEVTPAINTANAAKRIRAEVKQMDAATLQAVESAKRESAQADLATAQAEATRAQTDFEYGGMTVTLNDGTEFKADNMSNLRYKALVQDMDLNKAQSSYVHELTTKVFPEIQEIMASGNLKEAQRRLVNAEAEAVRLGLPRLRNEAAAEGTYFKQNISPYLTDINKITSSAGDISRFKPSARINVDRSDNRRQTRNTYFND